MLDNLLCRALTPVVTCGAKGLYRLNAWQRPLGGILPIPADMLYLQAPTGLVKSCVTQNRWNAVASYLLTAGMSAVK